MARSGSTGSDTAGDLVSSAAAELYSVDPAGFTARRKELATAARKAGDAPAARAIGALAKPTRSAWVVNKTVRADPTVASRLADLGGRLRAGEAALDGASIRELSRARRELISALVRQALAETSQDSPSVALRDEVTDTFSAALADPDVAEQVAAGTLTRAVQWAGFGPGIGLAVPAGTPASGGAARPGAEHQDAPTAAGRPARSRAAPDSAGKAARPGSGKAKSGQVEPEPGRADGETRREVEREARSAAEREARQEAERERAHRQAVARAEHAAVEAAEAADAAAATEREVADSVKFMEERLNRERQRLVTARRDARQAAAAADRAKNALDRLRR